MTFIVRKPSVNQKTQYDIVANADTARVEDGHLLLIESNDRKGDRTVAVYAPGEWRRAFEDGGVKQATNNSVAQPLSEELLKNNTND